MKFNDLLKNKFSNWAQLEKGIELLPTASLRGEVFEQFIFAYLNIKKQLYQIREIYRSKDIPSAYLTKFKLAKKDSGVDGLIIFNNDKSAGYQVKFRTGRNKPSYDELAKFWVESQHTDYNYTIANCYSITDLSKKQAKHLQILVDELELLDKSFFEELYNFITESGKVTRAIYQPYDFQNHIIKDVIEGYKNNNRGKLIAACATGKTLTSLWITEKLNEEYILFLAPSLALIKQTLEAWADQTKDSFTYLCVCSDKTVSNEIEDEGDISTKDFNVPVTTDPKEITEFLDSHLSGKKIIFSTYQSLPVLAQALNKISSFVFDIIIFDEAHRTAGIKGVNVFSLALDDKIIPSKRRLFMTATERLLKPRLKKKAEEQDRIVFSMDDEKVYGPVFHRFNFGEAIDKEIISDYKIILAGIQEDEILQWIKKDKNVQVKISEDDLQSSAYTLFSQILLAKAFKEYPIKKVISFHTSVRNAKLFTTGLTNTPALVEVITNIYHQIKPDDIFVSHINSSIPTGDRKQILDEFRDAKFGVVSNARCLTEGVDVPIIDSVYFVDPKNSLIDIVQACGRALRKPRNYQKSCAFFIVPVLITENEKAEDIFNLTGFETLFNLMQSLRDQDSRLEEWIDELNKNAVKGRSSKFSKGKWNPLTISLPGKIDLGKFEERLFLKIAEVNANPEKVRFQAAKTYGKKERKSDYKRIFKTLGDYSHDSYQKKLVDPTIKIFSSENESLTSKKLLVNHNNISHTMRLGLISPHHGNYSLTPIGINYWTKQSDFVSVFKRQMLRYSETITEGSETRSLFPYRTCLKILLKVKSINFFEFAFAIYTLYDSTDESVAQAIEDINFLRKKFPNLHLISEANKKDVLAELNNYFKTSFRETDIWSKKTTIYNQFIYFRDHLSVFSEFIEISQQIIYLIRGNEHLGYHVLSEDNQLEFMEDTKDRNTHYISAV